MAKAAAAAKKPLTKSELMVNIAAAADVSKKQHATRGFQPEEKRIEGEVSQIGLSASRPVTRTHHPELLSLIPQELSQVIAT